MTFPNPESYSSIPVYDLLLAASRGYVSVDLRLIRAIVDRGNDAIPDLLRFGMEERDDDRVDLEEDLIAMFRQLPTPEALPYLIECIRREPEEIPDDIIEAILPFREQALEPLLDLYAELDEEQGSDLGFLLAGLHVKDQRILDLLLDRLEYDAADGAFSLGLYGDPAALPALERILADVPQADAELRREIEFAINEIKGPRPEWDALTPKFDINEFYAAELPPPYELLEPGELIKMLEADSVEHRAAAAEGLRNANLDRNMTARVFGLARNDPDSTVRARCWEALADTEDAKEIHAAMKAVAADASRDVEERGGAIVGLCNATEDPKVATLIREFYGMPELRAKALESMWRSFDRQFGAFFPKHLDDPDDEIRRQAVWGTGYMGIGAEAPKLAKMFDDDEFRHDALFAYALCVPAEVTRGRVRGLLRKIDTLAGGLSSNEASVVQAALDQRLTMHGLDPVFSHENEEDEDEPEEQPKKGPQLVKTSQPEPGRNDPCPCGSGKKYKKCHGA